MKRLLLAITVLAGVPGAAFAHTHHGQPPVVAPKKRPVLICPVTGDKIASAKAAAGHSVYKGKAYYFCCAGCKPRFDKNPAKAARNAAAGKFEKM